MAGAPAHPRDGRPRPAILPASPSPAHLGNSAPQPASALLAPCSRPGGGLARACLAGAGTPAGVKISPAHCALCHCLRRARRAGQRRGALSAPSPPHGRALRAEPAISGWQPHGLTGSPARAGLSLDKKLRMALYVLINLGLLGAWLIALAGVSALQKKCHDPEFGGCRRQLGLPWWVIWFQFVAIALIAAVQVRAHPPPPWPASLQAWRLHRSRRRLSWPAAASPCRGPGLTAYPLRSLCPACRAAPRWRSPTWPS